jgi:hypothetical protein
MGSPTVRLFQQENAMDMNRRNTLNALKRAAFFAGIAAAGLVEPAAAGFLTRQVVQKPAAQEFGFGPRTSEKDAFVVYMRPGEVLRLRQLQTVRVLVLDARGRPVEGARISVDGGMPEHSHGLPTRPQVRGSLGGGMYDIEGVRFSMGGWWELKLLIETPEASDRVVFNLQL